MKRMSTLCSVCLTLSILLLLWMCWSHRKSIKVTKWQNYTEGFRGPFLDDACLKYDCTTSDGAKSAVEDCWKNFKKTPGYGMISKACGPGTDPEISQYACPETCDIAHLSPFVLGPGKKAASTPEVSAPKVGPAGISVNASLFQKIEDVLKKTQPNVTSAAAQNATSSSTGTPATGSSATSANTSTTTPPAWIVY